MGNWNDFVRANRESSISPTNVPEHAYALLGRDESDLNNPRKLLQPQMLLGYIKDSYMIRLHQNSYILLQSLFSMSQRDPRLSGLFNYLYQGWIGEMALTRTKDGMERIMQASVSRNIDASGLSGGYGFDDVRERQKNLQREQDDVIGQR